MMSRNILHLITLKFLEKKGLTKMTNKRFWKYNDTCTNADTRQYC